MAVVVPENDGTGKPVDAKRPPIWALVLLGIVVLIALPGPFSGWGWDDGGWHWWRLFGPLWLIFIAAVVVLIARGMRRGGPFRGRRDSRVEAGDQSKTEATSEAPTEATTEVAEDRGDAPPRAVRAIILVLVGLAAICAAFCVAAFAAWATATGNGDVVAGVVIALGVAIVATAFLADSRRVAPWLLAGALVLGLPAGAVAAADIHFDGGIGDRRYEPTTVADIPADGYDFGVGQLIVDLRSLPWQDGQTIPVESKLGVGQMVISVPSSVCVQAHATGKVGELLVRGDQSDGIDPEIDQGEPRSNAPRLDLDAGIQIGQLIVTDQDPDEVTRHGRGPDFDHNRLSEESQRQVCGYGTS
jgi:uncharacterized membrane protein